MGFWSFLTGGTKTAQDVAEMGKTITNGIVNGIDALVYTDEEKAQATQKAMETLLEYWKVISKENTEQSKARRELAKLTFRVYFGLIIAGVTAFFLSVLTGLAGMAEAAKFTFGVVEKITWLVGMIAGIYFGPHQLSKVWTSNKKEG